MTYLFCVSLLFLSIQMIIAEEEQCLHFPGRLNPITPHWLLSEDDSGPHYWHAGCTHKGYNYCNGEVEYEYPSITSYIPGNHGFRRNPLLIKSNTTNKWIIEYLKKP